ncbi:tyrosine-type recombinase/integrase [Gimesia chilikensis]|uniref:tyrosine-type recombinase/integrase n=1 Tax=Gimesia chilikensis TaxID=2605989 RepID=UPI001187AF22|nr:tyrosine-type recombinase/integrase [Gimesia chilikensis]QDT84614.1 Phage integrase family protein [Gimesia chilikensis]
MISSVIKFPSQLVSQGNDLKYILKLRDCFEEFVLPDMEDAPHGTLSVYLTTLNHWETRTDNPPVGEISNDLLREFKQSFQKEGYSPESIKKYWRHLRRILRRIGPQIQGNPLGESIIDRVPYMAPPKNTSVKIPRIVTEDELNAVYEACEVATWPKVESPALMWRLAIVIFYNCGPRTQDVFRRLCWRNVDLENSRISFVSQKRSKLQGIPFQEIVGLHFEAIYRGQDPSETVLRATKCNRSLYSQWKKIQDAAGIQNYIEFRDLRETCNSLLNAAVPGANAGKWVLGHGACGVNELYYHNPTPEVLMAVEKLNQPEAFFSILE